MSNLVVHRGPDGSGEYVSRQVGLGHRRLAIIDLSPLGHQPMASSDDHLWITYNGEIYNFPELRTELHARGYRFRSRTDTEVLLAAYQEFGHDCVRHLRGMFAFAIWDTRAQSLFLARDRLGKKPLYYYFDADGIAFASEAKAFLADESFDVRPDLAAITHYLTYQYVPHPLTAFQGVQELPPAHILKINREGAVHIERYWKLSYRDKVRLTEADASAQLLERLTDAVQVRLISDVPLGAFLSGGIDSGAIVAIMSGLTNAPVKTYSIGFEESEFNELPYARLVAKRYETDHHELVVRPDVAGILPELVWHYGQPFADSSAIPTYYLAQMTREHVTVALNGDGGDENFAGYDRYRANVLASRLGFLPASVRRQLVSLGRALPTSGISQSPSSRAGRFLETLGEPPSHRYARWMSHFSPSLKATLCTEDFVRAANADDSTRFIAELYDASDAPDLVDAMLDVDINSYLPDDLLAKVDVASMAFGLEARSPLLDHEFMEFCASLPSNLKLRGTTKKYIFKRAIAGLLPSEVINRPKMGFGVPLARWFRHELREMTYDLLLDSKTTGRGYFHRAVVERLLDEHMKGVRHWHHQLWNLVMLELWHRTFVDQRPSESSGRREPALVPHRSEVLMP